MKKYTLLFVLVILYSCSGGRPFEKRIDSVLGSADFRGFKLGDSYTMVMKNENSKYLQFPDSNILKYRYAVSDTEEYQWAYIFDNEKIKQIQFDAYLSNPEDGSIYCKKAKKKLEKNWGSAKEESWAICWEKEGKRLDLIDEGPIVSMGKVKILIYYTGDTTIQHFIPER